LRVKIPVACFEASGTITHSRAVIFQKNVISSHTALKTFELAKEEEGYCLVDAMWAVQSTLKMVAGGSPKCSLVADRVYGVTSQKAVNFVIIS
jgi:hypothetical protein